MANILIKKYLYLSLTAFIMNFIWEMVQMPFFRDMSFADPDDWLLCFLAALSDGIIVVAIFFIGRLFFKSFHWADHLNLPKTIYLLAIGFLIAVYFEVKALHIGEWSYSELMPIIPFLDIGLLPTVQMMLLPMLSYKLVLLFFPELKRGIKR